MPTAASIMSWLHIVAAVLTVGGAVFGLFFLRPAALKSLEPPVVQRLMGSIELRFRWVIWTAILIWIVTGLWLATSFRGITTGDELFGNTYGRTLLVKSILALVLFGGALSITLPSTRLRWFQARRPAVQRFNIAIAVIIILLAAFMVRRGGLF
ncbi:MAG: hypothetical protein FJ315_00950 [SAR202 cluster bacterium]|nr:hypothetical protein [SAR202 cluster bacterium]